MNDISIFDGTERLRITKPLRLIELFAGYGSQALALKYLGIPYEHYRISEWAIKSIQAYKDMHYPDANQPYDTVFSDKEVKSWLKGRISSDYSTPLTDEQIDRMPIAQARTIFRNMFATNNLGSICSIQARDIRLDDKHTYLLSYSFPCQDLSMAGLRQGMERGSSTRSGLLWEVERLLNEWGEIGQGPDILLMENVPEVVGQKNRKAWEEWIASLDRLGYKSYWEILNATDFGIPQNRRRCFMVSVRGDYYYDFPQSHNIKLRLKDVLESNVDEKYYLSDETVAKFICIKPIEQQTVILHKGVPEARPTETAGTIRARDWKEGHTVATREGINAVVVAKSEKDAGCIQVGHLDNPGRLESASRVYAVEGASPTLNTCALTTVEKDNYIAMPIVNCNPSYRIRKLTEKECFRLMGVKDEDSERVHKNQSKSSMYHLAGDSIVTTVLMGIFGEMFEVDWRTKIKELQEDLTHERRVETETK